LSEEKKKTIIKIRGRWGATANNPPSRAGAGEKNKL